MMKRLPHCLRLPRLVRPLLQIALSMAACLTGLALLAVLLARLDPLGREKQLPDFGREKPAVGEAAPDFVLRDVNGRVFHLADVVGRRPLVIECGSFTCSFCVMAQPRREELARKYQGKVDFLFVYGQETHPDAPAGTTLAGDISGPTRSWEERAARARKFRDYQQSIRNVLVDEDGARSVGETYGCRPNPLIVVGTDGRILLKQDFANSVALDAFLESHLHEEQAAAPMAPAS